jgi:oligopeptide/dipeptide ABC transporter ATP-binding protein
VSAASSPASSGASAAPSSAVASAASAAASPPALRAEGLVKHFPVRTGLFGRAAAHVRAVDGVSFEVAAGETFAIVGESGCGKSTVARLLLRLIEPDAGRVALGGDDLLGADPAALRRLRGRIQLVFQDPYGSLNPRMTAGDALAEPLMLHGTGDAASRTARVGELLAQVGLRPEAARRYPHEFSGGQRQRLAIARALAAGPQVIVCDEPVSALDVSIQAQILNLLGELQRRLGLAYVFISHDLAVVRQVATGLGVMYLGRFVETGPAPAVFEAPKHPYTRALLAAVPVPDPGAARERGPVVAGDVPSPLAPPPGCTFHTRCPHADERCRTEVPTLQPAGDGTSVACWHWTRIAPPASTRPARRAPDDALARLQAAFAK